MTAHDVLARMRDTERVRNESLERYTATRRYVLTNLRFQKRAEIVARVNYSRPGRKEFEVISEAGPSVLRNHVLRKMMEAETEGSQPEKLGLSRISAENYNAKLEGTESVDGHLCYILSLTPRSSSPYLVRGRAWVDSVDFAVVKLEGILAKNPSFWTRETRVLHRYAKFGPFWLPVSNQSTTDARFFGNSEVTFTCYDYTVEPATLPAQEAASADPRPAGVQ